MERIVNLPVELVSKIEKRIEGTEFTSVSDYISYVLRAVLAKMESGTAAADKNQEADPKKVAERVKRLESLGYLD